MSSDNASPKYIRLAGRFGFGAHEFAGVVVGSREELYLLFSNLQIGNTLLQWHAKGCDVGSSMGFKTNKMTVERDPALFEHPEIERGAYADLDPQVKNHPNWPKVKNIGDVWRVPRAVIVESEMSIWSGATLMGKTIGFHLPLSPFSQPRVRRQLRELGWMT